MTPTTQSCKRCGDTTKNTKLGYCGRCYSWYKANIEQTEQFYPKYSERLDYDTNRRYRLKRKSLVMNTYGSVCACCGESDPAFLTIEHSNADGNVHRASIGHKDMYTWLWKHDCPKDLGLEVLCWNCNLARHHYKICPHEQQKEAALKAQQFDSGPNRPHDFVSLVRFANDLLPLIPSSKLHAALNPLGEPTYEGTQGRTTADAQYSALWQNCV